MSNLATILTAAQQVLQAVPYANGLQPSSILVRMLPHVGQTLDVTPAILLAAGDPEDIKVANFANQIYVVYPVEVAVVAAVNHDYVTKLPWFLGWREQSRLALLSSQLPGAPTVWKTSFSGKPVFDRATLSKQYGYSSFTLRFHSIEVRTSNGP